MKRVVIYLFISAFVFALSASSEAQQASKKIALKSTAAAAKAPEVRVGGQTARPTFAVLFGSVTKIDTADPAKTKLEIKSEADGTTHTVELTPWTNVTKVTDVSELKSGDNVRLMTRVIDDKEVAMTVVFGKIRNIAAPRAVTMAPARPAGVAEPKK